ncbi:hypothetical protein HPB52_013250 [Rhipicephalus sanguineus]|uniref:Chloride channel protein 2 n=1 Tax=Rhipicephalus sanguineus TaxID=34632 RepID=A0A9D4T0A8_RHISA|nr:hypothetical protein HPB52_013250 [Rhipicephalus sanguineus]
MVGRRSLFEGTARTQAGRRHLWTAPYQLVFFFRLQPLTAFAMTSHAMDAFLLDVLSQMFGQYKEDLGAFAKSEALRLKTLEKLRKKEEKLDQKELKPYRPEWQRKCFDFLSSIWKHTFARLGEDWVFLILLGVISSLISFSMDYGISMFLKTRRWLHRDLTDNLILKYVVWVFFPVLLILFSSGFAHTVAPQAIGSGIPEMKTILRGVVLKEYLTFRALVAKVIGLTCTLGSGLPLGKEGPFVHISSMIATVLSRIVASFKGIYENESRASEMLAAACAVGVACTFAAPLGGVLFSIEVTSVFFAVRNYWRGFFAAACGALVWQLLGVWLKEQAKRTPLPSRCCVHCYMQPNGFTHRDLIRASTYLAARDGDPAARCVLLKPAVRSVPGRVTEIRTVSR